jgi:two-component system response regulator AtoC
MALTILIIDDEENARKNIGEFLGTKGYGILEAATIAAGREYIQKGEGDIILLDVQLPDGYGPNLLVEFAAMPDRPPIILFTAYGDIEMAVEAMKNGAHDFLTKPVEFEQLEKSIQRATEMVSMRRELEHYRQSQRRSAEFVVGNSKEIQTLVSYAHRAAMASVSVLITGETGTGKEVLARFIHTSGPRATKPFIAINCAAIQTTMLESELFGHEAGSFTGADRKKVGLMEVADGGILFLDEISSMPLDIQAKLLRALEERGFRRVGGNNMINVDVQIIAASNRPMSQIIKEEKFREDLYYRLKVVDLHLPALRDRKEDIPELIGYFVRKMNAKLGMNIREVSQRAMQSLVDYSWPGNIRELSNAIERATLFCDEDTIDIQHLPADIAGIF